MAKGRRAELEQVVANLGEERLAILGSVDPEGHPHLSTVSWFRGRPPAKVDLLIGGTAAFLRNIAERPFATLMVFQETVYALEGRAEILEPHVADMPIPLSLVRLTLHDAYDGLFTGGVLVSGPQYRKNYPVKLRHLDQRVEQYLASLDDPTHADRLPTHPSV